LVRELDDVLFAAPAGAGQVHTGIKLKLQHGTVCAQLDPVDIYSDAMHPFLKEAETALRFNAWMQNKTVFSPIYQHHHVLLHRLQNCPKCRGQKRNRSTEGGAK